MNPKGKLSNAFILSRFQTQNGRCFYCERPMAARSFHPKKAPDGFTDDHFIPKSRGGQKDWSNKVLACYRCNHEKSARLPTEAEKEKFRLLTQLNPPTNDVLAPANRNDDKPKD